MKFLIPLLAIVSCVLAGTLDQFVHQTGAYSHHQAGAYSQHQAGHTVAVQHEYIHHSAPYHIIGYEAGAPIVKSVSVGSSDGSYGYEYKTGNGISVKEHGVGGKGAQGAFSYTAPNGQIVHLSYVADEHGFHPTGSHIPQPPPTPAHVLRSLEYIAAHPHQEQKYSHIQAGPAHISAYSNVGHSQSKAYSKGLSHAQAYDHNSYAHDNTRFHQAGSAPYHHHK